MIAIDLGSNTLRVLEYDCTTGSQIAEYEKTVKTADGLVQYGVINNDAVKRVISAIQEAQEQIDFSSSLVRAVTTEAVRRAVNSDEVLSQIKKETGVTFEIISGEEEARLTLLAVKHRLLTLQHTSDSFVLIDIGGGSTELIFHYEKETVSKSFPLGIVTIAQTHETLENIEKVLHKEMAEMQIFCDQLYKRKGKVNTFVATAGTPTTVAAMKLGQNYETYDASKINGTSLEIGELDFYLKKLLSMPFEEREIAVGTGRSDLIAAGILIYKQLFILLGFKSCVVIDDGLREGVAIEACGNETH
ncbi:exopolyphosphatase [Sulfurovum sp. TSL6]|uniref:Ppx/GppA phosphatase family protein n=1 Tax=Sulfurovum sp. TSL6 TaxID=2826995 RepID=UPI001CC6D933|nr:phosphatase [Sulfurovum sp. TSL6]GIU00725.1 exopolyphosphatase [Sulfurovum sp. TSL6]